MPAAGGEFAPKALESGDSRFRGNGRGGEWGGWGGIGDSKKMGGMKKGGIRGIGREKKNSPFPRKRESPVFAAFGGEFAPVALESGDSRFRGNGRGGEWGGMGDEKNGDWGEWGGVFCWVFCFLPCSVSSPCSLFVSSLASALPTFPHSRESGNLPLNGAGQATPALHRF